jgi:hypothetical protein
VFQELVTVYFQINTICWINVKSSPLEQATKAQMGSRGIAILFLQPRHQIGGWVVKARPWPFYPRERSGTHCVGGWAGPTAGLGSCGKSRPPPGFDPRTAQPVASRYTDWAIPARQLAKCSFLMLKQVVHTVNTSFFSFGVPHASGSISGLWLIALSPYWTFQLSPPVPRCHAP